MAAGRGGGDGGNGRGRRTGAEERGERDDGGREEMDRETWMRPRRNDEDAARCVYVAAGATEKGAAVESASRHRCLGGSRGPTWTRKREEKEREREKSSPSRGRLGTTAASLDGGRVVRLRCESTVPRGVQLRRNRECRRLLSGRDAIDRSSTGPSRQIGVDLQSRCAEEKFAEI